MREYLQTPGLGLRLVNLPGYSPDFNADEAIWGWAREEATGNLCLGTRAAVRERVGSYPGWAGQTERGSPAALPNSPAIKSRSAPASLPARFPSSGKCTSHFGFSLVVRSIPALAGQPSASTSASSSVAVYPRAGGATGNVLNINVATLGLSPRWRGNRLSQGCQAYRIRSIPALAGQPLPHKPTPFKMAVYPRAGGATPAAFTAVDVPSGLSPRWRGNLFPSHASSWPWGSIPALAGQPRRLVMVMFSFRVYPRAGGATGNGQWVGSR